MTMNRLFSIVLTLALCFTTLYQTQAQPPVSGPTSAGTPADSAGNMDLSTLLAQAKRSKRRGFSLMAGTLNVPASGPVINIAPMASGPSLPVMGGGTLGRLTKWTGFTSSNSSIGDSTIYEDKFGKVGIGTETPADRAETMDLSSLLARARKTRRRGISLMPESSNANASRAAFSIAPMSTGPGLPVTGSGTLGRLTKWTGFTSSNAAIGDSGIYEDKFGKVGIGTDSPTSKLTVAGTIESASGGFKFPDGTVQTSSAVGALFAVAHDTTLNGDGTTPSPLGVAVPLILSGAGGSEQDAILRVTNTGVGLSVVGRNTIGPGILGLSVGGIGVSGESTSFYGVNGVSTDSAGVNGISTSFAGVSGRSTEGFGVFGRSTNGIGVTGVGDSFIGVNGLSSNGFGVSGATGGTNANVSGIRGFSAGTPTGGIAGRFHGIVAIQGDFNQPGNLSVQGTLSKSAGTFKIDHPLDPENKYLYHSFVESPDMMNIYNGNITTDENGDAVVTLPDYFDALNKDFRYQLTVIGTFAQAIVAEEIKDNRFTIRTNGSNVRVSWQVTGVRNDAFARKNRINVEVEKEERERGYYLHPEAFDQPEEKSINWARDPEGMNQLKQRRIEAEQRPSRQPNQR